MSSETRNMAQINPEVGMAIPTVERYVYKNLTQGSMVLFCHSLPEFGALGLIWSALIWRSSLKGWRRHNPA